MTSLEKTQNRLREFPCHFIWDLEHKSIKQFQSLMDLINEHIDDSPAMVVEGLLFKSYLFVSDFRGNSEKKKSEAIQCLNEARVRIQGIGRDECFKDGYFLIVIALEAWLDRRETKLEANIKKLIGLQNKYMDGSKERAMFQGSIYATKGFALSRLGMFRYAESIKQFEKALELCPKEKDWMFSLGLIKWRISKASVSNRNRLCDDMKKAETIFYNVLELDRNHSYALALIAKIKHRKKKNSKAEEFLRYALEKTPLRKKIIGEVAQTYRQMKKFDEALKVLKTAENMPEPGSFIYHQLYLVYRDWRRDPPDDYLKKAIVNGPSNFAAKFDRAKELAKNNDRQAYEYYDEILVNVENDPEVVMRANYQFALFLESRNKVEAIEKYQILLDKALSDCKENDKPPFIFFKEVDWMVRDSIAKIKNYYETLIKVNKNKDSLLKLALLEKQLGYTRNACWRYQQILDMQPPVDANHRLEILGEVAVMKTNNGLLDDVEGIIEEMEQLNLNHPQHNNIKSNLAVEKGKVAVSESRDSDALHLFRDAVKLGNITGAELLLFELQKMGKGSSDFYIYCAEIHCRFHGEKSQSLKNDLDILLWGGPIDEVDTVLSVVRRTQFNMERSVVDKEKPNASATIQECRDILNQTMVKFRDFHYPNLKKPCDYFNLPNCSSADIEKAVRDKLTINYQWTQFDQNFPDLFKFLVSIQPASNPQQNNWMLAFQRMNNVKKHGSAPVEKLEVNVYSNKNGHMAKQDFTTLEVARKACDKIRNILDEFYKHL